MQPFKNIKIPKKFDVTYIEEVSPMAAVAVGLALRRPGDR
jgi:type IV pilus assembly protein PilM